MAGWISAPRITPGHWSRPRVHGPRRRPHCRCFASPAARTCRRIPFWAGRIYTQDPGRALISGKCEDVGAIVIQQFRGLAARAPYFSNGSAASLREVVDFYDRRFNIRYSEQEKTDLVNFLEVL